MFSRRKSSRGIIVWCFILLIAGFAYGYISNSTQAPNKPNNNTDMANIPKVMSEPLKEPKEDVKDIENTEDISQELIYEEVPEIIQTLDNDNIITNNTKLIFRTYYEKTRDTITKEAEMPMDLVGRTLDEAKIYLQDQYKDWALREISKDKIQMHKAVNQISPNYFLVKEHNGYIAVFQADENGVEKLIIQTDIDVSYLSDVDLKKLQQGISVKGIEGVNQILEDYSS